jgi:nitrite reductase (NO-forming)
MFSYLLLRFLAAVIALSATILILKGLFLIRKKADRGTRVTVDIGVIAIVLAAIVYLVSSVSYPLHFAMPPTMQAMTMDAKPASLPIPAIFEFLANRNRFEKVADIGRDPNQVPPPLTRNAPETVKIAVHTKEVISEVAPGIFFNYWTYDGKVPGPMYRVRVGDTVELTISNDKTSLHSHNIDLHAVTGPGGGAALTGVKPGETKTFSWLAKNPGLYVYHCATSNVSTHNSHGQYGLILVEPEGGLPKVDKEFYLMQGELYTQGGIGKKGLMAFDTDGLINGEPTYVTFNGRIESVPRMHAHLRRQRRAESDLLVPRHRRNFRHGLSRSGNGGGFGIVQERADDRRASGRCEHRRVHGRRSRKIHHRRSRARAHEQGRVGGARS